MGDTIVYTYLVTNTGNVTCGPPRRQRPEPRLGHLPHPASPGPGPGGLGDLHRRSVSHRHPGRRGRRQFTDTATATGHRHRRRDIARPRRPSTATVQTAAAPPRSDGQDGRRFPPPTTSSRKVGDTIAYSYLVTNTGNVDPRVRRGRRPEPGSVTCPTPAAPGLAPGGSETCTADQHLP